MIPFTLADIKQNILGTPIIQEKHIQNSNFKDFNMSFDHYFNDPPRIDSFTTHKKNSFLFIHLPN